MSNSEPAPQVEDLLRRGIEATRAGDKATARALLEQVVQQDQANEKGWFWLAAVVEDVKEKRICLGNVLMINPTNERAQRLLDQLGGAPSATPEPTAPSATPEPTAPAATPEPAAPSATDERAALLGEHGAGRRPIGLVVGIGAVAILALVIVVVIASGGGGDRDGTESQANGGPTTPPANAGGPAGGPEQTQPQNTGLLTLTFAPSRTPELAPPTWTPEPTSTRASAAQLTPLPAPPSGLIGHIIMRSGTVISDPNNQPIVLIQTDGSNAQTLTQDNSRGHAPALAPTGSLFAYIRYVAGTGETLLVVDNFQGTALKLASDYWGRTVTLLNPNSPAWSPDGNWLAFTAQSMAAAPDLYRVSLLNPAGDASALERLTDDDSAESWPAFSPDGQRIVYAAGLSDGSTELRILNLADRQTINLTSTGADLIESAPDWSPDGQRIVFEAQAANSAASDIYWIPASGAAEAEQIIDTGANDGYPRFSPDGQYIVFSSDRAGDWDVYLYEIATQTIYQVTTGPSTDIANDWGF
jgi:TolB protein